MREYELFYIINCFQENFFKKDFVNINDNENEISYFIQNGCQKKGKIKCIDEIKKLL
jgi:sRNA-binding regulator protein Hfq